MRKCKVFKRVTQYQAEMEVREAYRKQWISKGSARTPVKFQQPDRQWILDEAAKIPRNVLLYEALFHDFLSEGEENETYVVAVIELENGTIKTPFSSDIEFINPWSNT
jgi:hypothetical protein